MGGNALMAPVYPMLQMVLDMEHMENAREIEFYFCTIFGLYTWNTICQLIIYNYIFFLMMRFLCFYPCILMGFCYTEGRYNSTL